MTIFFLLEERAKKEPHGAAISELLPQRKHIEQLRAACVAAIGHHPIKLVHACIVAEAKRNLIFSDISVEKLAYWLGFADASYFVRFFKREVGKTPGQFRKHSPLRAGWLPACDWREVPASDNVCEFA